MPGCSVNLSVWFIFILLFLTTAYSYSIKTKHYRSPVFDTNPFL